MLYKNPSQTDLTHVILNSFPARFIYLLGMYG